MNYKFIHLLYVPTMNCNMKCKYCYLEENTKDLSDDDGYLETLKFAVKKFKDSGIVPFNISLHGGEVTTLSKKNFHDLIKYINDYYEENKKLILDNGLPLGSPHIKTNLYNIDKHIETIREFNVSISGSLDLPLRMHEEYRITKGGKGTLDKILKNIKLLEDIPNKKKVSATIFHEHYECLPEIIKDIHFLEENTCLDMNDFNFMVGFVPPGNNLFTPMSLMEQVDFYNAIRKEFLGTSLDKGVREKFFAEFTPDYCSGMINCGEKFFLLERNGDIYSCVRGQKNKNYFYGNIFKDSVESIMTSAREKIYMNHHKEGFNPECGKCKYLYMCHTGCPYVKNNYHDNKSYTCLLQKKIYEDNKEQYLEDEHVNETVYDYVNTMYPEIGDEYYPKVSDEMISLEEIISQDELLKRIYSDDNFILMVDGEEYKLSSQILKKTREIIYLTDDSKISLFIKHGVLEDSEYPINNSLYMMLLSGNLVTYGDENRTKQEHIMTHQIYTGTIKKNDSCKDGYYQVDISDILRLYYMDLDMDNTNNLFFTTSSYRDYHYLKQKNNAYYHIRAINLPFQNIEFYYIKGDDISD